MCAFVACMFNTLACEADLSHYSIANDISLLLCMQAIFKEAAIELWMFFSSMAGMPGQQAQAPKGCSCLNADSLLRAPLGLVYMSLNLGSMCAAKDDDLQVAVDF